MNIKNLKKDKGEQTKIKSSQITKWWYTSTRLYKYVVHLYCVSVLVFGTLVLGCISIWYTSIWCCISIWYTSVRSVY